MRLLIVVTCLLALAAAGCAGSGIEPRKGMNLQEVKSLCITYTPGNDQGVDRACGGAAHQDICDTYTQPLPGFTSRAECLDHCEESWKTLTHRYTGLECSPQIPRGKELCRQYCYGLP